MSETLIDGQTYGDGVQEFHGITAEQYKTLRGNLNAARVANRDQAGKTLSYLEAWDVRAHLTRIFGFANWDAQTLDFSYMGKREYESKGSSPKPMVEVTYTAHVQLTIRCQHGVQIACYSEAAAGSESMPATMLGDAHDNALKTAVSDALKRCAINLGTQFGLSLYKRASDRNKDVIRGVIVRPAGSGEVLPERPEPEEEAPVEIDEGPGKDAADEAAKEGNVADSLGGAAREGA